ncbi:MAG: ATP-binding protein, partial [Chloroflexota bacterium]|nr:ATP-binding protein [Chloroflexota bacterium]
RFQEMIEQLEQAYTHDVDEQEMLEQVRKEVEATFGVRLSSILRFISTHLLTQNERNVYTISQPTSQQKRKLADETGSSVVPSPQQLAAEDTFLDLFMPSSQRTLYQEERIALLTQTAEAALVRTNMLGELTRLLLQLQQSTGDRADAWCVIDLHGICVVMNPAAEVFCGMRMASTGTEISIEEVFASILTRVRNIDEVRSFLQRFTSGNVEYRHNLRYVVAAEPIQRSKDEEMLHHTLKQRHILDTALETSNDRHYQLTCYPLYNQQRVLIANALQIHDVTEQVRDEKNKSTLLASVSHELRTPLTTIKAAVTGLLQKNVVWDEETRHEILEDIDSETDHLAALVNALVEMSRIQMGALSLEKEWCDIAEVFYGAFSRLERSLADRTVRKCFQQGLPLVHIDHVQIGRVFYTLIENMLRNALDRSEIVVTLDVIEEHGTRMVRAQLLNASIVIPIEERKHIFHTFYRGDTQGSGWGLAMCRGIVEAHQGKMQVGDMPDGEAGSCFTFTLPVLSSGADAFFSKTFQDEGERLQEQPES